MSAPAGARGGGGGGGPARCNNCAAVPHSVLHLGERSRGGGGGGGCGGGGRADGGGGGGGGCGCGCGGGGGGGGGERGGVRSLAVGCASARPQTPQATTVAFSTVTCRLG
eukprot:scaffold113334_cov62-Phaeocystis_antarctica.AAC.2